MVMQVKKIVKGRPSILLLPISEVRSPVEVSVAGGRWEDIPEQCSLTWWQDYLAIKVLQPGLAIGIVQPLIVRLSPNTEICQQSLSFYPHLDLFQISGSNNLTPKVFFLLQSSRSETNCQLLYLVNKNILGLALFHLDLRQKWFCYPSIHVCV